MFIKFLKLIWSLDAFINTSSSRIKNLNHRTQRKRITVEGAKPEGIGGNELSCNTAPVATSNNSDFGSVCGIIDNTVQEVVRCHSSFSLLWKNNLFGFQGWSHEETTEREVSNAMQSNNLSSEKEE